jgi:DNA-binding CsgD family transcriptional regulator
MNGGPRESWPSLTIHFRRELRPPADPRARAAPRFDQPLAAKKVERTHDRRPADAELLGESTFRRQTRTRPQPPTDDRGPKLVRDVRIARKRARPAAAPHIEEYAPGRSSDLSRRRRKPASPLPAYVPWMTTVFRSGDALMAFAPDLRVDAWNDELESLTGIPAGEAIGRPCWEVLGGLDERGAVICHPGCSAARLAREGWPVRSRRILIRTAEGRKLVTMSTIAALNANRGAVGLHLFRPTADAGSEPVPESHLTARQHEVLELVAEGGTAKAIATRLGVAEVTVRNHIRAILLQLGCHSQLEALAEARRRRLLPP